MKTSCLSSGFVDLCTPLFLLFFSLLTLSKVITNGKHQSSYNLENQRREHVAREISSLCASAQDHTSNVGIACTYLNVSNRTNFYLSDQLELDYLEALKFSYLPPLCEDIEFLVLVNSGNKNSEKRRAIRKTWKPALEKNGDIKVYFFTAESMDNNVSKSIRNEAATHQDMIILQVLDEYSRISIKLIMMYRWIRDYCKSPKFLIKGDDDIVINPNAFRSIFTDTMRSRPLIVRGERFRKAKVMRASKKESRWNIPTSFYPLLYYPDYCNGPGFIQSRIATMKILDVVPYVPINGIDDVLLGGFAGALAGVKHIFDPRINAHRKQMKKLKDWTNIFSWVAGSANNIEKDWKKLKTKSKTN